MTRRIFEAGPTGPATEIGEDELKRRARVTRKGEIERGLREEIQKNRDLPPHQRLPDVRSRWTEDELQAEVEKRLQEEVETRAKRRPVKEIIEAYAGKARDHEERMKASKKNDDSEM